MAKGRRYPRPNRLETHPFFFLSMMWVLKISFRERKEARMEESKLNSFSRGGTSIENSGIHAFVVQSIEVLQSVGFGQSKRCSADRKKTHTNRDTVLARARRCAPPHARGTEQRRE